MPITRSLVMEEWFEPSFLERKNHFLGIGINAYQHVPALNNAVKDVEDVAQVLRDIYRFEEERVEIIRDTEATRSHILSTIGRYAKKLTAEDNLILYFSGHGVKYELLDEGYWIPVEGGKDDFSSWIDNSTLIRLLEAMKAHHVLMIVDACFSGSVFSAGRSISSKYDTSPSRFALTSGALEIVPDGEPGTNSPFASRLLEGLRNNEEPFLLTTDLAQFVKKGDFRQQPLAHPLHIDGHKNGEFVFYQDAISDPDEEAWEVAKASNTQSAYQQYLSAFAEGKHVQAAKSALERLKKAASPTRTIEEPEEPIKFTPPVMVEIKGGTFMMGSDETERENPIHQVTLDSFELGVYPVTQREWKALMGKVPGRRKNLNLPVDRISFADCQAFIQKLNEKTGLTYRLATEAEWEYAAGGGSTNRTRWAGTSEEGELGDYAWHKGNRRRKAPEVGKKKPNPLGLYDMSGNVWEWCADWYGDYSAEAKTNPTGPAQGSSKVIRGGSFDDDDSLCRVSSRYQVHPERKRAHLGFRLARSVK